MRCGQASPDAPAGLHVVWIKICGIRDLAAAREVAAFQPDAIGLNFYARSPRCVDPETAAAIVRELPAGIEPIALFVNHQPVEIRRIARQCGVRTLQLHGDEPPELLAELGEFRILRAFRFGPEGWGPLAAYLEACRAQQTLPAACLIDSHVPGTYGGSGQTVAWSAVADGYDRSAWPPLILAGGLQPDNISAAIEAVRPWGVDVASGVESSPGVKHRDLVSRFIANARAKRKP